MVAIEIKNNDFFLAGGLFWSAQQRYGRENKLVTCLNEDNLSSTGC
jgi:hypothetical protein